MVQARVRHVHSSSRFDRTPTSLWNAVKAYVLVSDLVTFTEVSSNRRAAVLARFAPGWSIAQVEDPRVGEDECAVIYARWKWRLVDSESIRLSDLPVPDRRSSKVYALCVTLEHRGTRQRLLVSVAHLPAHVEGRQGFTDSQESRTFRDCVRNWNTYLSRRQRINPHLSVMAVADWNLDLRKDWARGWLNGHLPRFLASSWARRRRGFPDEGTHGSRLIDDTQSTLGLYTIDLMKDDPSSDHRPYREVLLLPRQG